MNYHTVSCEMHSELELAIMHGQNLKIYYLNEIDKIAIEAEIKPHDIVTRGNKTKQLEQQQSGEFLLGTDSAGNPFEIRLDFIQSYCAC